MNTKHTDFFEPRSDADCWQLFKKGSEQSFTYLHQKYYNDLYFYSLKIAGNEAMAKNAIQELFIYLWKNRTQLGDARDIKHYLIFSVRRHVVRLMQKENKFGAPFSNLDAMHHFTFSQEDILITRETEEINKDRIIHALNQLSGRQRELVYLRYFNELSNEEIAEVTGLNYQSVLNGISKALANLRKIMITSHTSEISLVSLISLLMYLLFF